MNMIKITNANRTVVFVERKDADRDGVAYTTPSSTNAHPLVSINYLDGQIVGASARSVSEMEWAIGQARKQGWVVEELR